MRLARPLPFRPSHVVSPPQFPSGGKPNRQMIRLPQNNANRVHRQITSSVSAHVCAGRKRTENHAIGPEWFQGARPGFDMPYPRSPAKVGSQRLSAGTKVITNSRMTRTPMKSQISRIISPSGMSFSALMMNNNIP